MGLGLGSYVVLDRERVSKRSGDGFGQPLPGVGAAESGQPFYCTVAGWGAWLHMACAYN